MPANHGKELMVKACQMTMDYLIQSKDMVWLWIAQWLPVLFAPQGSPAKTTVFHKAI
jgi:hypothetical protein